MSITLHGSQYSEKTEFVTPASPSLAPSCFDLCTATQLHYYSYLCLCQCRKAS